MGSPEITGGSQMGGSHHWVYLVMYNQGMASPDDRSSAESCPKWLFYFDGNCSLCRWVVKWLSRMDFGGGIAWVSFRSLERPPHGLTWRDLELAAYLKAGKGDLLEGFPAFRQLTRKVPALWPLAPIFWLPGIHVPGSAFYRWVAANRYRLSRCAFPHREPRSDSASD